MDALPTEIIQAILCLLSLSDLQSVRLVSHRLSLIGREYLISPIFTSLPHAPSINRLLSLSQHPYHATRITSLLLCHGEVNEYHARHNTYFLNYMRDESDRLAIQDSTWGFYRTYKTLKETHLPHACDTELLTPALANLPNLQKISISLLAFPFPAATAPELLHDIWRIPSTRALPRVATVSRFTDLLASLPDPVPQLKHLSHDRLPFEFFIQKKECLAPLLAISANLHSLDLGIEYSDRPNDLHASTAFANLEACLRRCTALTELKLAFRSRRKIDISPLLVSSQASETSANSSSSPSGQSAESPSSSSNEAKSESCPTSNDTLTLPSLTHLTLSGVLISSSTTLSTFILAQPSLHTLRLGGEGMRTRHQPPNGGVHLMEGTWRDVGERLLLSSFGGKRKEDEEIDVKVRGDLVGVESGERWVVEDWMALRDVEGLVG